MPHGRPEESLIAPHGGTLVDRFVAAEEAAELTAAAADLPQLTLSPKQSCDLEMIAHGAFSPLTGFVGADDFASICDTMHLAGGPVWPIPITLAVDDETRRGLAVGGRAALRGPDGTFMAEIEVEEIYPHDKAREVKAVFRTDDSDHPGVAAATWVELAAGCDRRDTRRRDARHLCGLFRCHRRHNRIAQPVLPKE